MTIYTDPKDQFIQNVNQCLDMVEVAITQKTPDGSGIYGYPAMILLMSVIDAMGNNFPKPERKRLNINMDFGILAYPCSDFGIPRCQIKNLYNWYRNKLSHMGLIAKDAVLRGEPNDQPFEFASDGQLNTVYLLPLFDKVKAFWHRIDKNLFESPNIPGPAIPADLLNSTILSLMPSDVTGTDTATATPAPSGVYSLTKHFVS